jgi:peptidoglycan hydrolase-like protein with peptidoglycan-binding domain
MKRTLTAAVALGIGLGMAGLAQAQMNTSPATPSNPTMTTPSPSSGATGAISTQNPGTTTAPGTNGTYGNSNQMNQAPQANAQTNQYDQGTQQTSEPQVEQAQQQLKSAGLYRGAVDGIVGPETQTALTRFQRQQGLPQTAQLDQQTMNRLMGADSGANNALQPSAQQPSSTGTQPTTPATAPGGLSNH